MRHGARADNDPRVWWRSARHPSRTSAASSAARSTSTSPGLRAWTRTPSSRTACRDRAYGVIRGLHLRVGTGEGKLVRCSYGRVFDVVVDLRPDSPTYRTWLGFELDGDVQTRSTSRPAAPTASRSSDRDGRHHVPDRPASRPVGGPDHRLERSGARNPVAPSRERDVGARRGRSPAVRLGRRVAGYSAASDVRTERGWAALALLSGAAFLALMVLNTLHQTQHLDVVVWRATDPDGGWGTLQLRAVRIIDALQPTHLIALFAVVSVVVAERRRSWQPVCYFCLLVVPAVLLELGLKWILPRVNPRPYLSHTGGSFPSGHMLSAVICSGGIVLLLATRSRWWHWLLAVTVPAAVGAALLIGDFHWASDVVGGALLGTSLLAISALASTRRMADQSLRSPKRYLGRSPTS